MRSLIWATLALVGLIDAGAEICIAVVATAYAIAWAASLPFALAGRGLLVLSRRLTHGRAP